MNLVNKSRKWFWNLAYCMIFYLLVSIILYIFVKEFDLWVALVMTAISYPLMVLFIATILRMRGDITEKSFIGLVLEGFKITHLLQKSRCDSTDVKMDKSSRSKKQPFHQTFLAAS
jgi:hypothetical protein